MRLEERPDQVHMPAARLDGRVRERQHGAEDHQHLPRLMRRVQHRRRRLPAVCRRLATCSKPAAAGDQAVAAGGAASSPSVAAAAGAAASAGAASPPSVAAAAGALAARRTASAMHGKWPAALPSPNRRERVPGRFERENATLPVDEPERWRLL